MTDNVEDEVEASRAPLLDHLIELRRRLVYIVSAILVAFVICYIFSADIYRFLTHPLFAAMESARPVVEGQLAQEPVRMIYTDLTEAFFTYLKVAFFGALFLSFPIVASQVYMFVAPGLYKNERQAFWPFLVASPILFLLGAAMLYYLIFPMAWHFFLSFQTEDMQALPKVNEYLSLVTALILAFGVSFQLPVVLTLLGRAGIVSSEGLARVRKYAIVGVFAFAAVVTPPDVISQVSLALPMLLLYEISILTVRMIEKKRDREAATPG
ncbi:twin-arginine translocase subunit TatC [Zavarzinia sp. CC-PAN008]|uniref:twin-arginine translocase subunit TatC n=1 Tax=Zavarzinia sp. CC-PAN008 TaxID=3243332 RepID=UPI003F7489D5